MRTQLSHLCAHLKTAGLNRLSGCQPIISVSLVISANTNLSHFLFTALDPYQNKLQCNFLFTVVFFSLFFVFLSSCRPLSFPPSLFGPRSTVPLKHKLRAEYFPFKSWNEKKSLSNETQTLKNYGLQEQHANGTLPVCWRPA